jgi:two-component system nitrogen regulation sensor histidine kinase GlnL
MRDIKTDTILDNLNCSIICLSSDLVIHTVNNTAEMFFDTSQKILLNRPFSTLFKSTAENSILDSLDFCLQNNHEITELEANITLWNGRNITSDYSIHPIPDHGALNLLVEIRPADRHVKIAREEQRFNQQLATQQLARGMAHEIKNPLGGIRGAAQLLEAEINNPALKEYTDVIIRETDRLQKLLNSMLGPNKKIEKKHVNILEILEHVRNVIQAEFSQRVIIHRNYDPSIPDLYADRDQLIQAFLNVARNAAQAIKEQGEITVKTRVRRQITIGQKLYKHAVQIDIIDNGPGISEAVLENLFLPMVTDKPDGTGLGLPIAQQIIAEHGGVIQCQSDEQGTTFTTIVPLEELET